MARYLTNQGNGVDFLTKEITMKKLLIALLTLPLLIGCPSMPVRQLSDTQLLTFLD